jgi:biotin carboxyl carrier protein
LSFAGELSGAAPAEMTTLVAPMTSSVQDILYEVGESVSVGDDLMTLESMKVMHNITSPCKGKITKIFVEIGEVVNQEDELLQIEEE